MFSRVVEYRECMRTMEDSAAAVLPNRKSVTSYPPTLERTHPISGVVYVHYGENELLSHWEP